MQSIKGQTSFVMKPLTLIAIVVLLVLLIISINSFKVKETKAQKALDITSSATNILLLLANSEDCLAFKSPTTQGAYANIVDINKLTLFVDRYSDIEPECARNYDFGWRVKIIEYEGDIGGSREVNAWEFGAKEFSKDKALKESVTFWLPIAVRHSQKDVRVARMELTLVNGELEKVAGFLDWSCRMGMMKKMMESSTDVQIQLPITYNTDSKELCSGGGLKSCRRLLCELDGFEDMESAGRYSITTKFIEPNKLQVVG